MIKELFTTYKYSFSCSIAGVLLFIVFLTLGVMIKPEIFSRGGSIIVLFGAMSEYGLLHIVFTTTS